jgi:hypothetical protein
MTVGCRGRLLHHPNGHISLQVLSSTGIQPIITVGTPGNGGTGAAGICDIGVSTPCDAAMAAATIGLHCQGRNMDDGYVILDGRGRLIIFHHPAGREHPARCWATRQSCIATLRRG